MSKEEITYLKGLFEKTTYDESKFTILVPEDKCIAGILSGAGTTAPHSKCMKYKTIYDTIIDLDKKIKISFSYALECVCSPFAGQKTFSFISTSESEMITYYYIENALFRTSSLWDMLAQMYVLYYDLGIEIHHVHYKNIFNPDSPISAEFTIKAQEIHNYINEEGNTDVEGLWKGNHAFVNGCRNQMTHRNSPNVFSHSDLSQNMKKSPIYLLKRIIEDYSIVTKYIEEIVRMADAEVMEEFRK